MKNAKLLAAAALLLTAAGAYAGTDDGNVQGNVPTPTTVQAPAPAAAAVSAAEREYRTVDSSVVSPNP